MAKELLFFSLFYWVTTVRFPTQSERCFLKNQCMYFVLVLFEIRMLQSSFLFICQQIGIGKAVLESKENLL